MTVITRRVLEKEKIQQEREIEMIKKLSEAKNRLDRELSQSSLQAVGPALSESDREDVLRLFASVR